MLILDDDTACSPIALSVGLPGGIQLSKLPDRRNVCEAMAGYRPRVGKPQIGPLGEAPTCQVGR